MKKWLMALVVMVVIFTSSFSVLAQPVASWNYLTQTGLLGTTYSWIDCSAGQVIVTGDDNQALINWPFNFRFYNNSYTTSNSLSVCTNGFIRLDGNANPDYSLAASYNLTATSTNLGQIIALGIYDNNVAGTGWVRSLTTGSAPNRIFTIEFHNLEIDYDDNKFATTQVSFYESSNRIIVKTGNNNININSVDLGIHSGVNNYYNKWQEVRSGTKNAWIEYSRPAVPPAASFNYVTQSGTLGNTYSWIDCSTGAPVITGDDSQALISWPFNFNFYDNSYNTSDYLSVATNGFIRLDGTANTSYTTVTNYDLLSSATTLGQIIATGVADNYVGRNADSWCRQRVTGTVPYRIFTIEFNNLEIDYNDALYADIQVSFYETLNEVVLKFGNDNINTTSADLGIHSGVSGYFHKWQEVQSGINNTWIRYTRQIEVTATAGEMFSQYQSLKEAFDKINDGTHRGSVNVKINASTTETSSAVLNASGIGNTSYTTVNVYPTWSGLSISGNLSTPLIDINGASNLIIDGRVNMAGIIADLAISNASTSSLAGTSTIRFINDASQNTVRYCIIKGAQSDPNAGVVFFATTTQSNGNDNNTISNNHITGSGSASRPLNAVFSLGSAGKENNNNNITNNFFYNFLKQGAASNGIHLSTSTSAWNIIGNSFYETSPLSPSGSVSYKIILINNPTGGSFVISGNYIGGNQPLCSGSPFTKSATANNAFIAISLYTSASSYSSLQNNVIRNISWSNSGNASFTGIQVLSGSFNIGTNEGNIIGAVTGTNSVSVIGGTTGLNVIGFDLLGTGTINFKNNSIGSVSTSNASSQNASNFIGINLNNTGTSTIQNNIVGSETEANSITAASSATGFAQTVAGVVIISAGNLIIHDNIVANFTNSTTNSLAANTGYVTGITSGTGNVTITNNQIYNLNISNANNASNHLSAVTGINIFGNTGPFTISHNQIHHLSNSYEGFSGSITGLYVGTTDTTVPNVSDGNFIHNLTVTGNSSGQSSIYGIKINSGLNTISNNIVSLGGIMPVTIYGIFETGSAGNDCSLYFNTISITGSPANGSAQKSYALFSAVTTNNRDFRNNIFSNTRSTSAASGLHFAMFIVSQGGTLTVNYNNYFIQGEGGIVGYYGSAMTTLPIVSGQDQSSLNIDPLFENPGNNTATGFHAAAELPATGTTGINTDYNGITRGIVPKMGALENNRFIWKGSVSSDFGTSGNWLGGSVPPDGSDFSFDASPLNHCILDRNRSVRSIQNLQATYKLVLNGFQLTVRGVLDFQNGAGVITSGASSALRLSGTVSQPIISSIFENSTISILAIANSHGVTLTGNITVANSLILESGAFAIGTNTLTLNGSVNSTGGTILGNEGGGFTGGISNIIIGGSGLACQLPSVTLNNLTINRPNGAIMNGDVAVNGILTLTNGVLTVGSNTLILTATPLRTAGSINAESNGAVLEFANGNTVTLSAALFSSPVYDLILSGSGGVIAGSNFTVLGNLNLQGSNINETTGKLHMIDFILDLGSEASITGDGDITGIVRRTSFVANRTYSFSHQNTSITFTTEGVLPSVISLKTLLGEAPVWKPEAVKRKFELIQSGGSGTQAILRTHYLDSELNGNSENMIVDWSFRFANNMMLEHGRSNFNTTNNWIELSNADVVFFTSSFGNLELTISESELTALTWNGSVSTSWVTAGNWTPNGAPSDNTIVIIPDASTTPNDPSLPANATCGSLTLQDEAILNSQPLAQLTVNGSSGAWVNQGGTFNASSSMVIFTNQAATIIGTTTFHDLKVATGAKLTLTTDAYISISGSLINEGITDATFFSNTVEYNGADQSIINTNGISTGYHNLVLNGNGIKSLPLSPLLIHGNLITQGSVTTHAGESLTIEKNVIIGNGTILNGGNFDHIIQGNFENNGTFNFGSGKSIVFNGAVAQTISGSAVTAFEKLNIDNLFGISLFSDIIVNNNLILSNGTLNTGTVTLSINGLLSQTNGNLQVSRYSSLNIGGTTEIILQPYFFNDLPVLNNLSINRTGGVTFACNVTIHGVLELNHPNPTATKGLLDLSNGIEITTLLMGPDATTTGEGDVTGIVKRTVILPNTQYTFGNRYTHITFPDIGVIPTEISLMIRIGVAPSWKPGAIKRIYDLIQTGGNGTQAILNTHYLDSELNGNSEARIVNWSYHQSGGIYTEHGRSNYNSNENWISLSHANIAFFAHVFGAVEVTLDESELLSLVWNGSVSTSWVTAENWTPAGAPSDNTIVIIPDAATTINDPLLPLIATCGSINLESGAILNATTGSSLTVNGSNSAWSNQGGIFNSAGSTIIFTNSEASLNGTTQFYNLTINSNAALLLTTGSISRISGTIINNGILRAAFNPNTFEYNGGDQQVINANGLNQGYHNLILSGSGIKTLPDSQLLIKGGFTVSDNATVMASGALVIEDEMTVGANATFNTGANAHSLKGNLVINGQFAAQIGNTFSFDGSLVQTVSGTSSATFQNLIINNSAGVSISTPISVLNQLTLAGGEFNVGSSTLTLDGGINQISGKLGLNAMSSLVFSGSEAVIMPEAFFNSTPVIGNLTINRNGGVTFATDLTVIGTLNLQSANPSASKGSLDMIDGTVMKTLYMGSSAITTGIGDVTGIVNISNIIAGHTYQMGNAYNSVTFPAVGTLPQWMSIMIKIGDAPSWKTGAVKRIYDVIQSGGSGTQAVISTHYLDSELNGNEESGLVDFSYRLATGTLTEHGRSGSDGTNNWVSLSNVNVAFFSSIFGTVEITLSTSELSVLTWNGSVSTSWITADNWTPLGSPSDNVSLIIPDATSTQNDPQLPVFSTCKSVTLQSGAILNALTNAVLTINGGDGAWVNQGGTFNSAETEVVFTSQFATLSGTTNFHNITINPGAILKPLDATMVGVSGIITNNGVFNTGQTLNTIRYNGADQTIIDPNGPVNGYHCLILDNPGIKSFPGKTLVLKGDFILNEATFNTEGITIIMNGYEQAIGGNGQITFNDLTIATSSTTTVSTPGHSVNGVVVCNGNLYPTGNLTMNSTSAQTAIVSGAGTGTIHGNLIIQRYLAQAFGYRYLSSPFFNATVSELADEVNLQSEFPVIYRYEENRDTAWWFDYTSESGILNPMHGYAVNFGTGTLPVTVDMKGEVSSGSMSINLSNNNRTITQGFNLVGNPYPSPINWDAPIGWTRENVDNAVYFFNPGNSDQYTGTYSTYINGVSSDGIAGNIIPAMQAFFVHVTDGSYPVNGSLGFSNEIRVNSLNPDYHKNSQFNQNNIVRLSASFSESGSPADFVVILPKVDLMGNENNQTGFNAATDALKMMNTNENAVNVYVNDASNNYAIKSWSVMADFDSITVIPLGIKLLKPGIVKLNLQKDETSYEGNLYLHDRKSRAVIDLSDSDSYDVLLEEGKTDNRFSLLISGNRLQTNPGTGDELSAFYSDNLVNVYLDLPNGDKGVVDIHDITGRLVFRESVSGVGFHRVNLNTGTGIYIISLSSDNSVATKKLFIPQQ